MQEGNRSKFTPDELAPQLQPLLEKLFAAFRIPESSENEWLMKCVMRVISFVGKKVTIKFFWSRSFPHPLKRHVFVMPFARSSRHHVYAAVCCYR